MVAVAQPKCKVNEGRDSRWAGSRVRPDELVQLVFDARELLDMKATHALGVDLRSRLRLTRPPGLVSQRAQVDRTPMTCTTEATPVWYPPSRTSRSSSRA